MGSFGAIRVAVPRARLDTADGRTTEWINKTSGDRAPNTFMCKLFIAL
jgi:hypothetical protein